MSLTKVPQHMIQPFPGNYYWNGYYNASQVNYWTNSNATFGDFTVVGSAQTLTMLQNSNFGTVNNASGNLPGVDWNAVKTGTIEIEFKFGFTPGQNVTFTSWGLKLLEATTPMDIDLIGGGVTTNAANFQNPVILRGTFSVTAGVTYSFRLRSAISQGQAIVGGFSTAGAQLSIGMKYLNII